jgi:hypothetical protein
MTTSGCTLPVTQTITGPATVSPNQTGVTYSVPPPASGSTYTWSLPPGAVITSSSPDNSAITVTFGASGGTVGVTETNAAGSTTSTLTITMNTTGISTGLGADSYLSYPSPFIEETTVKINASLTAPLSISISDVKGNTVYESVSCFTNEDISLGKGLASGVYMVKVIYGSKIQMIKIVKL